MTTDVAKVYGGALYDLAAEEGLEDELLTQQQTLTRVLAAEPQWLRLLHRGCRGKAREPPCRFR